ncbi:MAG: Fe(2+)-trafficking protein [Thermoanaerobaculia bacterium]
MSTPTNEDSTVECVRCNRTAATAQGVSWGGALGDEIRSKICNDCWTEWQDAEVMVINELKLNFMDPDAQSTLIAQLREFLQLGDAPSAA